MWRAISRTGPGSLLDDCPVRDFRRFGAVAAAGEDRRRATLRRGVGGGVFLRAPFRTLLLDVASDFEGGGRVHFSTTARFRDFRCFGAVAAGEDRRRVTLRCGLGGGVFLPAPFRTLLLDVASDLEGWGRVHFSTTARFRDFRASGQ